MHAGVEMALVYFTCTERAKRDAAMDFEAEAARIVAAEEEQAKAQEAEAQAAMLQQQTVPPPGVQAQAAAGIPGDAASVQP
eukprot:COSAG06_NODE_48565_length_331_cov_0.681034_2_plen_80_part_01